MCCKRFQWQSWRPERWDFHPAAHFCLLVSWELPGPPRGWTPNLRQCEQIRSKEMEIFCFFYLFIYINIHFIFAFSLLRQNPFYHLRVPGDECTLYITVNRKAVIHNTACARMWWDFFFWEMTCYATARRSFYSCFSLARATLHIGVCKYCRSRAAGTSARSGQNKSMIFFFFFFFLSKTKVYHSPALT